MYVITKYLSSSSQLGTLIRVFLFAGPPTNMGNLVLTKDLKEIDDAQEPLVDPDRQLLQGLIVGLLGDPPTLQTKSLYFCSHVYKT